MRWTTAVMVTRLPGPENMALDVALFERAGAERAAGWRVYGWDGPWVSLGKSQDPRRDLLDPDLVPWVMRPTGGKAVLHGHDVTVAIAMPLQSVEGGRSRNGGGEFRSVRTVYRLLTAPIIAALRECGLPASLAETAVALRNLRTHEAPNPRASPDCFGSISPNDIVHEKLGLKVCGCALRVTREAALLQASIPAGPPLVDPRRLFERPSSIVAPRWNHESFADAFTREISRYLERARE